MKAMRSYSFAPSGLTCIPLYCGLPGFVKTVVAIVFLLLVGTMAAAQNSPAEHIFQVPRAALDKALQDLHVSTPGRLPILDGFVGGDIPLLEKYRRGYYQYRVEVRSAGSGATLLRVSAKVTAWYAGSGAAQAGYRELPSNGRLEADLIERLEESLQQNRASVAGGASASPSTTAAAPAQERLPATGKQKPVDSSAFRAPLFPETTATRSALAAPSAQELAQQKRVQQLTEQSSNLEEVLRNQARPNDLAAVLKTGTPVLAKPLADGDVLFRADAEDEFKVLDESDGWVHVQVSGISRGWIRRPELEMPGEASAAEVASQSPAAGPEPEVHEETSLFPGDWPALRGRMVRIRWVQSESGPDAQSKADRWQLARSAFRDTYNRVTRSSIKIEGIVIVIDAADGGMIAATTGALQRWSTGAMSDAAFRKACWADPPEALGETAQREGGAKSRDQ